MKELIRVSVQYALRQQCCKTNKRPLPFLPYNYIPETGYVSRVYCVAAVLNLQFILHVMLFRTSTHRSMYAVPNIAVFCSSLISCFPGMFFRYCLSDSVMVRVAPILTGFTFVFTYTEFLL